MMTLVKVVEVGMYILGVIGIGVALGGIGSVIRAFARKQDQLLRQRIDEANQQHHTGTGLGTAG